MSSPKLHALAALFKSPEEIFTAATECANAGYTRFDVNTPYPVHGMDRAMKLPKTKLPMITLIFGLLGLAGILLFQWWTLSVDFPIDIGGNPHFALPAFMPPTFEITVLSAVLATVFGMIAFFFKFPRNSDPLHGTEYMKRVSSDMFGLVIYADDPLFASQSATDFLKGKNAEMVTSIYEDDEGFSTEGMFNRRFGALLAAVIVAVAGGTYVVLNQLVFLPPFDFMVDQHKLNAQMASSHFSDKIGMRRPVEGTVARGFMPYSFANDPEGAGRFLVNPLPRSKESLERGQVEFNRFCSPCHGNVGMGDSRLHGQFPIPPSLHSDKVRDWSDGRLYHVITEGQNVMPGYAKQISRENRWAIIHYIRALQRAVSAKPSDVK